MTDSRSDNLASRRAFAGQAARWALAGVLAAATAMLVRRPGAGAAAGGTSEQTCLQRGICRSCARRSSCGLPAALSLREHAARSGGRHG